VLSRRDVEALRRALGLRGHVSVTGAAAGPAARAIPASSPLRGAGVATPLRSTIGSRVQHLGALRAGMRPGSRQPAAAVTTASPTPVGSGTTASQLLAAKRRRREAQGET
jgi:hypothetical protein